MTIVYGIDLGTTYTKCAYVDKDGKVHVATLDHEETRLSERTPALRSAVTLAMRAKQPVAYVGSAALIARRRWREGDPPQVTKEETKMWLGADLSYNPPETFDPHAFEYRPEDFGALILRRVALEIERANLPRLERVVITHPQVFTAVQRQAVRDAAAIAQIDVVDMLTEPDAAAYAYARELADGRYLVFDLGGGTLDIVALEVSAGTASARTSDGPKVAGRDFDRVIYDAMVRHSTSLTSDEFQETLLSATEQQEWLALAERTKRELNVEGRDPLEPYEIARLPIDSQREIDAGNLTEDLPPLRFTYSLREFEDDIAPLVLEARDASEKRLTHLQWAWDQLKGVLLVGGSSRVLAIRRMLEELAEGRIIDRIDPATAVVRGAAQYAHDHAIARGLGPSTPGAQPPSPKSTPYTGALARGLGVKIHDRQGRPYIDALLAKDTRLPLAKPVERTYKTQADGDTEIEIELYEGESTDPDSCDLVGRALLSGFPKGPAGTPVGMTLRVEANGRHHIALKIGQTERECQIEFDPSRLMRPRELDAHRAQIARVHVLGVYEDKR